MDVVIWKNIVLFLLSMLGYDEDNICIFLVGCLGELCVFLIEEEFSVVL